jgi:hypothetical protein
MQAAALRVLLVGYALSRSTGGERRERGEPVARFVGLNRFQAGLKMATF